MWLEKCSSDFKLEEDSPIVLVWVLLPELSFHCHTWYYIKQKVGHDRTRLSMGLVIDHKTRPSMAKVRVEIDPTKPKLNSVWVGSEDESNPLKGFTQKLEYENVPIFCKHYGLLGNLLGHSIIQCKKVMKKEEGEGNTKGKTLLRRKQPIQI